MSRFGEIYERVRPLIIWLGLGELAWIGFWLLNFGDTTPGYMATAVGWLVGCDVGLDGSGDPPW